MEKHAFLILAHNDFEILRYLLESLDDERNDIFIHFDKKIESLPRIETTYANLFVIENRVDVSWGDVSMIEAEYALFEYAFQEGEYKYYHLLSGVDIPIQSQDKLHCFFNENYPAEFIGYSQNENQSEIDKRVKKIHLFPKSFRNSKGLLNLLKKIIRALFLRIQYVIGYNRCLNLEIKKGTQWVSITSALVKQILSLKKQTLLLYKNSYCSDELFVQTICWNSIYKSNIYNPNDEAIGCQRKIGWQEGNLIDWTNEDYEKVMKSNLIFARKFNSQNVEVVKNILIYTKYYL